MKKYIALIIAIIVLGGGAFLSQKWYAESFEPVREAAPEEAGIQNFDSVSFTATTSGTVLETMRALAAEGTLSFSGRDFPGLGFFVEEIKGKKSTDGYYWILLINGVKSDLGASSARVKANDVVEWRYEKGY